MGEALTAVARILHADSPSHRWDFDECELCEHIAYTVLALWLEHPDVAGCDNCDKGVAFEPHLSTCTRCVVVTVGDIPNVRVRKDTIDWIEDLDFVERAAGVALPAVEVSDTDRNDT